MNQPTRPSRPARRPRPAAKAAPAAPRHPLLVQLGEWHPELFGDEPRPLKRGIYEDLMAAHGEALSAEELKAALALHTRSTRYLNVLASGQPRRGLDGQAVEPVAPDQRFHAIVEVHRRRQQRSPEDMKPQLQQRIVRAFEGSGLGREAYAALVRGRDEAINAITEAALDEASTRIAREAALLRAFEASGQDLEAFASGYGMPTDEARRMLERARQRR
ncbi:ProQ/FinO family protein [Hydrogenophaga intermedia]|jgi:ProP effector|uniref:ProQ/FinO family protein n=1 Tax=Hydrogenophaga intermedia TaxID=65786 RepID=UPI002043FB51|nr:ProQ/FinO family protein [Hydrogenophaga intermedia]MCM3563020.1 ProQ/FinO family protein [Hydrogenophaga intermedia]